MNNHFFWNIKDYLHTFIKDIQNWKFNPNPEKWQIKNCFMVNHNAQLKYEGFDPIFQIFASANLGTKYKYIDVLLIFLLIFKSNMWNFTNYYRSLRLQVVSMTLLQSLSSLSSSIISSNLRSSITTTTSFLKKSYSKYL